MRLHLNEPPDAFIEDEDCQFCDGWGTIATGPDPEDSRACPACDGSGRSDPPPDYDPNGEW